MTALRDMKIGVIGLGYVGLPLAVAFAERFACVGFDIKPARIAELQAGRDSTLEVSAAELAAVPQLRYSSDPAALRDCNVYIVTVPTPINEAKQPDLRPLQAASRTVGTLLAAGDLVIYESTVYPGATEEVCVPILEQQAGLLCNRDFSVGYSPERINPGDHEHNFRTIRKVTAGSNPDAAERVDMLYRQVVSAGTYRAESIRVAEAAKVIENTQRDVNIALINELALLFERLHLDTEAVLRAAATKWNFLPFRPGLVGGHCIGVDPYYLTHKAQTVGFHPAMILAGRRVNDGMGVHIAQRLVKLMIQRGIRVAGAKVLLLGLTFKENCPDLRNTRVIDIVQELRDYQCVVAIYDPWVDGGEARHEYGLEPLADTPPTGAYDAVLIAVAHRQFIAWGAAGVRAFGRPGAVLFDVKSIFPATEVDGRL